MTQEQYQGLLSLFQQNQVTTTTSQAPSTLNQPHVSNQVSAYFATHYSIPSSSDNHFVFTNHAHTTNSIIEMGATDHIYCSLLLFTTYTSISPIEVWLPIDNHTFGHMSGLVYILNDFILHDILCLPSFKFNLI